MKHTVCSIFGARPQFIKAFAVSRALSLFDEVREIRVHSGQHYDPMMSQVFFEEFGIGEPDFNLGSGSAPAGDQSAHIMERLEDVLEREKPECVIVFGDTNTTLAGALPAAKLRIPVAHVEAGLRSGDRTMPEEANRIITDSLSELLFCPTPSSAEILEKEGVNGSIHTVGDVMVETFQTFRPVAQRKSEILEANGLENAKYILLTVHRASNTDEPDRLRAILDACGSAHSTVFFPVHPRTAKVMEMEGITVPDNVVASGPVSYVDTIALECGAELILTDSGGMQKEAYLAGVPCITLRENTEWVETVDAGWNILTGPDSGKIAQAIREFRPSGSRPDVLGPPDAASAIAEVIIKHLKIHKIADQA